ncbi:hypothetical protein GGR04_002476 [Aureimonas pseudogalii]|uniref:Uncharacterized protein n=2 Tax=Aureimonas pseudogalii TaxID=1744844 RepID=A0A7W6H4X7_9HYPH|nr:hypothetical protein [Aureimonas pseudogalii]
MTDERYNTFKQEVMDAVATAMTDRRRKLLTMAEKAEGTLAGVEAAIVARVGVNGLRLIQNFEDDAPNGVGDPILAQLLEIWNDVSSDAAASRNLLRKVDPSTARTPRKLEHKTVTLIEALARSWVAHIDPDLALPRRDPNPTSPLLRFIDAMMLHALGADRPEPKVVLTFLADHVRPALRQGGVSD